VTDSPLARRPPWAEFRRALEQVGFRPTKARGQNFLLDGNIVRAIARDAGVGPGDRVVEIGAGCGFLTFELARLGVDLVSFEVDERLHRVASGFLRPFPDVRLVLDDCLPGKHELSPALQAALPRDRPWHLVSNLPYGIAAPLIGELGALEHRPASVTVLVQREVAERLLARPGEPAWGAISARLAPWYRGRLARDVPASLFWPRPRVASAVARLALRPDPEPPPPGYAALVDGLLRHRRKQLRGALAQVVGDPHEADLRLQRAGLDPTRRPGELAPAELFRLVGTG